MDDSFGNYIYILLMVAAFVISALGKKKKRTTRPIIPNNENINSSEEKPFLSNLERLLNEKMGVADQKFQDEYADGQVIYEEPKTEKKQDILDTVPEEMLDDKEDVPYSIEYEDTSKIFSESIKESEIKSEEEPVLEDFNLRDAIIYSEIINRKEY